MSGILRRLFRRDRPLVCHLCGYAAPDAEGAWEHWAHVHDERSDQ